MINTDNARAKKRNTKSYKKTRIRLFSNGTCTVIGGKINFWFGLYPPPDQAPRALDVVTLTEICGDDSRERRAMILKPAGAYRDQGQ